MKYKLGDICEIVSGSTPKTSIEEYWDGDIKWITPAELTDDSYIIDDSARKLTALGVKKTGLTPFPAGTVILSSRAPIGKVAIAGCEMYCNQGFKNLICSDKINNKYLYWFLKGKTTFLNSLGRGATFKEISKGIVGKIEINVPDAADQERTVVNLEKLSEIIKLRKKELEEFDNLIKARFVELFGRPEDKKYPSVRLGDYAKFQSGYAFKSKDFVDEGVPLVQIGNVNKDYLDWDVVNAVPDEYIYKYSEFALSKDDLVMAMTRPIIKSLDSVKIAKVAEADLPCLLNQRVGRFQIKDKIHPVFLEILCKTDDFKDYVERMSGNSLQPNISSKQVEDYIIILPPIELQEKFAEFVKQVDKSKVAVKKALDETQTLFDSLMQEYFG